MNTIQTLSLALGSAWAAGINLYAAVFMLGIMNATGGIQLPPHLQVLSNPIVLTVAGIMFVVEFFADKVPVVDSTWDLVHTFIRIPAGAILAAQAIGPVGQPWQVVAALVGGGIAAGTHAMKAGTRLIINTSPEPFSNWTASLVEDAAVIAGIWTAVHHPYIFLSLFCLFVILVAWLLPRLLRAIRTGLSWLFSKVKARERPSPQGSPDAPPP